MINVRDEKLKIAGKVGDVKSVFDVACGFGFFSRYFLNLGCNVTGLDLCNPEIDDDDFKFLKQDIRDYKFGDKFDLNVCSFFLHFFDVEYARKLIIGMQGATNYGGYNLLVCMSDKDGLHDDNFGKFYVSKEELMGLYSDWELVSFAEGESEIENRDNIGKHNHDLIFALFRKES